MKTIKIDKDDIQGSFITPPRNQGQIVTVSYAATEDYIIEHEFDGSDRSETYRAYRWPKNGTFEPQNAAPKLGRPVALVEIV